MDEKGWGGVVLCCIVVSGIAPGGVLWEGVGLCR
jgi:hypothetical protein